MKGHEIIQPTMAKYKSMILPHTTLLATAEATTIWLDMDGIRYGNRQDGKNLADTYITRNPLWR